MPGRQRRGEARGQNAPKKRIAFRRVAAQFATANERTSGIAAKWAQAAARKVATSDFLGLMRRMCPRKGCEDISKTKVLNRKRRRFGFAPRARHIRREASMETSKTETERR